MLRGKLAYRYHQRSQPLTRCRYFAGGNQAASLSSSVNGVPGFRDADHDALLALVKWTENGTAPEHIIATKWVNDTLQDKVLRQRPLCPYPQQAKFVTGNPDLAENVSTRLPHTIEGSVLTILNHIVAMQAQMIVHVIDPNVHSTHSEMCLIDLHVLLAQRVMERVHLGLKSRPRPRICKHKHMM